jgi:adenylyltransferase/sulfurtransferase
MYQNQSRYRAIAQLPGMGNSALERFSEARVAVVGCGGLGVPLLMSLASSGVGHLRLIDFDVIEASNLSRQWLYDESEVGQKKASCAAERIRSLNSIIRVEICDERLMSANAHRLLSDIDVVVDATDNFATRYCICDVSYFLKIPMIMGALHQWEGQVATLNFSEDGTNGSANYRDVFPTPPAHDLAPACSDAGTMASICGVISNIMAQEVLMTLLYKPTLAGALLIYNSKNYETIRFEINKKPLNPLYTGEITLESLMDYDEFCHRTNLSLTMLKECSPKELKEWLDSSKEVLLVDVREQDESEIVSIGGTLIPLSQLTIRFQEIPKDKEVVVYCRSGVRSANAIRYLEEQYGYTNLINLKGGILGWISDVDSSLTRY